MISLFMAIRNACLWLWVSDAVMFVTKVAEQVDQSFTV